jgi:two-component system osmolarity sensor histidine kinase EnvZ
MTPGLRRPRSLLWRLGALALAVTVVSLCLHVFVIAYWIRPLADTLVVQLTSRARMTRSLITATPAVQRDTVARGISDSEFELARGQLDMSGLAAPPELGPEILQRLGPGFRLVHEPAPPWSREAVRLWLAFEVEGEPWRIRLSAQPPVAAILGTGVGWLLLAAVAVGSSLLVGLRFIVGPIREVAHRIGGQGAALQPVPLPRGASIEVQLLVESFNRLVDKVQAAHRTQQQMLAGLSHDLRTPLARLRLRIETQCEPGLAAQAEAELQAVEHIIAQFLAFVHGDTGAHQGGAASALQTARQVMASYARQGVEIGWEAEAADARIGSLALQRVLTNLIDNAVAHGRPPIAMSWREPAPGFRELGVWDHGPGLSAAQFETAQAPFVRLSNDAPIGHCGLGLAIVAQIAQQWQASLACQQGADGRFGILVKWRVADAPGAGARG